MVKSKYFCTLVVTILISVEATASNFSQFLGASSGGKNLYVTKNDGTTRLGRFLGYKDPSAFSTQTNWIYHSAISMSPITVGELWYSSGTSGALYFQSANCTGTPLVSQGALVTHAFYSGQVYQINGSGTYYSYASYYSFPSGTCQGASANGVWMIPMMVVSSSPICGTGPCKLVLMTDP